MIIYRDIDGMHGSSVFDSQSQGSNARDCALWAYWIETAIFAKAQSARPAGTGKLYTPHQSFDLVKKNPLPRNLQSQVISSHIDQLSEDLLQSTR